ncbi:hypothetical protein BIT28_24015 [Photobacterium proteolyticum]|uniref:Uncharacterized protein n=1 Tax=Photobacterium proteolyticum TaxID=1903952 RepID=A0A1Q9GBM1_9GAMM|nr:hypothetical protein BIT28_24015 [Photobacterium proteolyticum]
MIRHLSSELVAIRKESLVLRRRQGLEATRKAKKHKHQKLSTIGDSPGDSAPATDKCYVQTQTYLGVNPPNLLSLVFGYLEQTPWLTHLF